MKIVYYFTDTCKSCKDMRPIISLYAENNNIEIEEKEIKNKEVDIPTELTGLPFIELYDNDNNRLSYFQGHTSYKLISNHFNKWIKR